MDGKPLSVPKYICKTAQWTACVKVRDTYITVRQTSEENSIRVTVSDTGCGISRESREHIFDKFYQGDTSHSREGNGLGLALVKRVLELMDGDIHVVSEEGRGSAFTVTLPAADIHENRGGAYHG